MSAPDSPLALLEIRFARLEAEHRSARRRHRSILAGLGLLVLAVPLLGAGDNPLTSFRDLSVESLTLRDKDGKARVRLIMTEAGDVAQSFLDDKGTERLRFAVEHDGTVRQRFFGADGKRLIGTAVTAQGGTSQQFFDKNEKLRASRSIEPAGVAGDRFYDAEGKFRLATLTNADGMAASEVIDPAGKVRVKSYTDKAGRGQQVVYASEGKARVWLYATEMGSAGAIVADKDGKNRMDLGVAPDQQASLTVLDEQERPRCVLGTTKIGPRMALLDTQGHRRILDEIEDKSNQAVVGLRDQNDRLRIGMGTMDHNISRLSFFDDKGSERLAQVLKADGDAVFIARDAQKRLRSEIGTFAAGDAAISCLFDWRGVPRITSRTADDGDGMIEFRDHTKVTRISLGTEADRTSGLQLFDQGGTMKSAHAIDPGNAVVLDSDDE